MATFRKKPVVIDAVQFATEGANRLGTARGCGNGACTNDVRPGQRYCRRCHAAASRKYYDQAKARRRTTAWEVSRARLALATAGWLTPAQEDRHGEAEDGTARGQQIDAAGAIPRPE